MLSNDRVWWSSEWIRQCHLRLWVWWLAGSMPASRDSATFHSTLLYLVHSSSDCTVWASCVWSWWTNLRWNSSVWEVCGDTDTRQVSCWHSVNEATQLRSTQLDTAARQDVDSCWQEPTATVDVHWCRQHAPERLVELWWQWRCWWCWESSRASEHIMWWHARLINRQRHVHLETAARWQWQWWTERGVTTDHPQQQQLSCVAQGLCCHTVCRVTGHGVILLHQFMATNDGLTRPDLIWASASNCLLFLMVVSLVRNEWMITPV